MQAFIFPLDGKKFTEKNLMYEYIENNYSYLLNDDMSAKRLYFNLKNKKLVGKCVMSGKPTKFNETTEKYERFHSDVEKELYRKEFIARMKTKYGTAHLLNSPEQQSLMLKNRSISKNYIWKNKKVTVVTSQYEYDFLEYLESTFNFEESSLAPPPTIYYKDTDGTERFYLPDFFIPSMNLIVEIKGTNNHYQKRDAYKEKLKETAVLKNKFSFIQINDREYSKFNLFFTKHVKKAA
jgi:hypothetical protein